jgi:phytoene synthase
VRRIRDAGWLLRRGRPVLSAAQLAQAGVGAPNLASATARRQLPDLLRTLAEQLWEEWPPAEPRSALTPSLRVQLALHRDLLRVLERSAFDVTDQRISLTPLRKFWLAWRATR